MKRVLMVNRGKAYLPEIQAYEKYFAQKGDITFYDSRMLHEYDENDFDVIWRFMGLEFCKPRQCTVHEYVSLSMGSLPRAKDFIKRNLTTKPHMRVFLNTFIRDALRFNDTVPYCIRDMGIDASFFRADEKKEYDFVYVGAINTERGVHRLLAHMTKNLPNQRIVLIGSVSDDMYHAYKGCANVVFTGQLKYHEISKVAAKGVYGINNVPPSYQYLMQTSTKLLEYCAMGLKPITMESMWVNTFERERHARFFRLTNDCSNLSMEALESFDFVIPDVHDFLWERVLDASRIYETLKGIL